MKKTLLATAVAGAIGATAGAAQAATVYNEDGTQLDIYGNIQIAYKSIDTGSDTEDELFDNGSTVGFKGQHVINPGLMGYFKAEFEHTADEEKSEGGLSSGDQAYLGLKGNFGDARVGSWDALIDDWVQDPISNNEYFDVTDSNSLIAGDDGVNTQNSDTDREGDKIQYMSPVFGGLQFAVGAQYKGDAEGGFDDEGNPVGENVSSSGNAAFFGGAKYTVGSFSVAGVYDNLDNYDGEITGSTYSGGPQAGDDFDAGDQFGVTFQYTMEALRLAAKYERYESGNTDYLPDENRYALGARYGYGMGDIYGSYQYVDVGGGDLADTLSDEAQIGDNVDSRNEIVLGATYNISPAMYTFVEAAWYDKQQDADDGVAVGAVYSF
ncbi:putative porin [Chromohalobacter marismortui]|uniref:Putative porin n=1 Tax=Chromohalobacter marismortui TaxID=42055 RepID=A0A4R7NJ50_9GAMM|nr:MULTISPECIES: porin [Chromohalobacter]MCI0511537.1 porin [Chromohalobacter sp.]MCI0594462.1 porin [Chromohalobacter sp.]TDU20478.1 putative porin [Chromohalobacter marismortui]